MIQEALHDLALKQDLSRDRAAAALGDIMEGKATQAQIGAFLMGLRVKGETVEEITGLASTMRAKATRIVTTRSPLVDTCGTGGDHSGTFNISTAAAFVAAGSGVAVAKHGNRSATSKCGSADVLEALGVQLDASPDQVGRCIDDVGIGFLFARALHTCMKHVAGPRAELKTRTVFNILGPLTNPAGACGQVIGVFDRDLVETLAQVLANLGTRRAFVVSGPDGLDELGLSGPSTVCEVSGKGLRKYEIRPEDAGLAPAPLTAVRGGGPEENAGLLRAVLEGQHGPHRDIVLLNAAAALLAADDHSTDWREAVERASSSIDSGSALAKLDALIAASGALTETGGKP
ncbi:MAG: anthranilate phosphoribosyltransferase [Candidatus Hydrogenedentota bacterium]